MSCMLQVKSRQAGISRMEFLIVLVLCAATVLGLAFMGPAPLLSMPRSKLTDYVGPSVHADLALEKTAFAERAPLAQLLESVSPGVVAVTCKPHGDTHSVRCEALRGEDPYRSPSAGIAYFEVPESAAVTGFTVLNVNSPEQRVVRFDMPAAASTRVALLAALGVPEDTSSVSSIER